MSLADDNGDIYPDFKAFVDSGAYFIQIADNEADEKDALDEDSIFFLLSYHLCKGL